MIRHSFDDLDIDEFKEQINTYDLNNHIIKINEAQVSFYDAIDKGKLTTGQGIQVLKNVICPASD